MTRGFQGKISLTMFLSESELQLLQSAMVSEGKADFVTYCKDTLLEWARMELEYSKALDAIKYDPVDFEWDGKDD